MKSTLLCVWMVSMMVVYGSDKPSFPSIQDRIQGFTTMHPVGQSITGLPRGGERQQQQGTREREVRTRQEEDGPMRSRVHGATVGPPRRPVPPTPVSSSSHTAPQPSSLMSSSSSRSVVGPPVPPRVPPLVSSSIPQGIPPTLSQSIPSTVPQGIPHALTSSSTVHVVPQPSSSSSTGVPMGRNSPDRSRRVSTERAQEGVVICEICGAVLLEKDQGDHFTAHALQEQEQEAIRLGGIQEEPVNPAIEEAYQGAIREFKKRDPRVTVQALATPVAGYSVKHSTVGVIPYLRDALEMTGSWSILASVHTPHIQQGVSDQPSLLPFLRESDKNWGCGYRNLQMLLSVVRVLEYNRITQRANHDVLLKNLAAPHDDPNHAWIQSWVHKGWDLGFDEQSRNGRPNGRLGSHSRIGAYEAYTALAALGVKARVRLFHKTGGHHVNLMKFVVNYFTTLAKRDVPQQPWPLSLVIDRPPIYVQYIGHSITIVGVERIEVDVKDPRTGRVEKEVRYNWIVFNPANPAVDVRLAHSYPTEFADYHRWTWTQIDHYDHYNVLTVGDDQFQPLASGPEDKLQLFS